MSEFALNPEQQAEIENVELYYDTIGRWQAYIYDQEDPDTFVFQNHADIIREIDGTCPYVGQPVLASGWGVLPEGYNHSALTLPPNDVWGYLGPTVVEHQGVDILKVPKEADGRWLILQRLHLGVQNHPSSESHRIMSLLFAHLDVDASIVPVQTIANIFNQAETNIDETVLVRHLLNGAYVSQRMAERMSDPEFFTSRTQGEQIAYIDKMIELVDRESGVRESHVVIPSGTGYTPVLEAGALVLKSVAVDSEMPIEGLCLGWGSLNRLQIIEQAISKPEELYSPSHGLHIVVDPDEKSKRYYDLDENSIFYCAVPTPETSLD